MLNEGQRLEKIAKSQPRKFWKSLKKCYSKRKNNSSDIKLDDLYEHFSNLLGQQDQDNANDINITINADNDMIEDNDSDMNISEQEVRKALFKQKNGKASGPDDISAEILKVSYSIISPYLVNLFNKMFTNAEYPESWSLVNLVPIFKGGDAKNAKNYRGITLNNIIAKVYSQVLLNRLTDWTEKHEKISDCQFGYQKGKSTIDCIFILHSIVSKTLNSGQKLYSIFIDYEKCSDRIDRVLLWQKLLADNVSSKMTNAIKAMYSTVRAIIKHNRQTSNVINSNSGVKQGDPSSSLLFMMFVNDIVSSINTDLNGIFSTEDMKLFLVLFADDQVLFSTSPTSLQSMLNDIESYCTAYGLKINVAKTKVLIFEKSTRQTHYKFSLYNENLEVVNSFKYLGVYFFKNGNGHRTQKCIAEHASKAMHRLFSVFNNYEFKTSEKCKLFGVLVSPVLNYSCEIWGLNEAKNVEQIHTKFLRKILCVKKSTNLCGLYGELGRVPLAIMRKFTCSVTG